MRNIIREPLLHFFLLGAAIFAAYAWLSGDTPGEDEIVVTEGRQRNLIQTFERTWLRPPTRAEFEGLVEDFVRQEIAYREAGAMELDRDDIVIRRRLRQKLELLTEDLASLAPPTQADLEEFYRINAAEFRTDPRVSFEHIYFSVDARGGTAGRDASELLAAIDAGRVEPDAAAERGDRIALPPRLDDVRYGEVATMFGAEFAEQLSDVPVDGWAGPIASGFGLHLVRVFEHVDGRIPELTEVESDVRNELLAERRSAAVELLYESLGTRYTVRIEPFDAASNVE